MKTTIKQFFYVALLSMAIGTLNAQNVGINATGAAPSGDAMLDIAATNKGLLVPRVNITNLAAIAPITGGTTISLLVYNTNATTGLGYYYWDGASWVRFSTGNPLVDNGLYFNGGASRVRLGGALVENTTITQGAFGMTWNLSSTGDFNIQDNGTTLFSVQDNGRTTVGGILNAGQFNVTGNSYFSDDIYLRDGAVNGGDILVRIYDSADDGIIDIYENNAYNIRLDGNGVSIFNEQGIATNDFRIESNGQANMFFVDAGNDRIGIGTAAPTTDLHMTTNVASGYMAWFENTAGAASSLIAYNTSTQNALGGATNLATGIGAYGVALQATGTSYAIYGVSNSSNSLGVRGSIPTTGTWTGYGGLFTGGLGYVNGLYNLSDERVKKDIELISGAVDKLKKIKGVSYKYNLEKYSYLASGDTRTYLGFLAQDVQKIFPEAVSQKEMVVDGPSEMGVSADMSKFQMEIFNVVDYTAIVPVTVEAIKEQQLMIEALNSRIEALEKMVLELKK